MNTLRPFQAIGNTFVSTGSSTADAISGTPMGVSTLRVVNTAVTAIKVAVGDTAAEATAKVATQYLTIPPNMIEYVMVKNTQRFVDCDTADIPMLLGTGGY
jgi:hypothetical protein